MKYRFSKSNRDGKDRTMKNKEEPSANSQRGKRSDALSRPGSTVAAQAEQPALSLFPLCGPSLLPFVEPPDADPHVRWCGEGHR